MPNKTPNYTKLAVKGAIIVFIVSMLAAFLGYIARVVLARNLSVEDFGLFNAVFSFLGMIGIFKSLGFDKALIKFIPEFRHENRNDFIKSSIAYVAIIQLITNIIVLIAVYFLSSYLSIKFFHSPQAGIALKIMAIAFFLDSFVLVIKFTFQGFKEMLYFSMIDVVRMLIVIAVVIIGFKLNYGLLSPIAAYIVAPAVLLIIFGSILLKRVFPEFFSSSVIFDRIFSRGSLLRKISKYSIFVMETGGAALILYYTDILALTYFSDLKNVGLYSVALPTAKVFLYFPRVIGGILLPLTAELWAKKEEKLLAAGMELLYKFSIIIIVPLVFIMLSFTDLLITVLYGPNYILASAPMKILSIGMLFAILYGINISFFAGIGQPKITSKIVYISAIFNFIANIILIPRIGIIGAAIATTISYFIMMAVGLFYIKRFVKIEEFKNIKIEFPIKIWIKTLGIGLLFIFIIWLLKKAISLNVWAETAIVLSTAGLCYILLLFLLKVVNVGELMGLYKRVVK